PALSLSSYILSFKSLVIFLLISMIKFMLTGSKRLHWTIEEDFLFLMIQLI
ncbi:hypothetical protein L9F63_010093, partial [Diploptera punctata]